jgi:hypothetical protein
MNDGTEETVVRAAAIFNSATRVLVQTAEYVDNQRHDPASFCLPIALHRPPLRSLTHHPVRWYITYKLSYRDSVRNDG